MKHLAHVLLLAIAFVTTPAHAHVNVPGLDVNGQCIGDGNSDAQVAINELITAVNNALGGCARLPIQLTFQGQVGKQAFACGSVYAGIGTGAASFTPADFRLYVSNVKLISAAGDAVPVDLDQDGVWQYQNVALLDFEDGTGPCTSGNSARNTAVHGSAPAGVYTSVQFDVGVPFDLDHGDVTAAVAPLNDSALFVNRQSGYQFLRIETADGTFPINLNSSGCESASPSDPPTSCAHPNLATITLSGFNPEHSVIVADLATLLADSNLGANQDGTAPGCASDAGDQDCAPIFRNLGLTFPDGAATTTQNFFRIESDTAAGGHLEVGIASNADGSGTLFPHEDFDITQPFPVPFNECFGGTGAECDGGTRLFSTVNPGFSPLDEAEPEESAYPLADGTAVTLILTAVDAGLSFRINDTQLSNAGDSVLLGQTPGFHADVATQITLPGGGEPSGTFTASFRFTTTSSQYQNSDVFTLKYTPVD